jgi:type I restriction enzyme R subunit
MAVNPKYYEKMSELLDALIAQRKKEALDYKAYLAKLVELTRQVSKPDTHSKYPLAINSPARRALYDNLKGVPGVDERFTPKHAAADAATDALERAALAVDEAIRQVKKADWRGNRFKEREVRNAIQSVLGTEEALIDGIFEIVKAQREY